MNVYIFKKKLIYRLSAYLLIIPFIPAIRPLLDKHNTAELVLFFCGLALTIFLIVFSNSKAYIRISDNKLFIYLMYRHKPEIHHKSSIEKIMIKSPQKLIIKTEGFAPLEIRLNKKEQIRFVQIMEEWEIPLSTVYRNS